MMRSPFVFHEGKCYLVINFSLDGDPQPPSPTEYTALLHQHGPANVLVLRSLSEDEAATVTEALDDAAVDAWAHLVGAEGEK